MPSMKGNKDKKSIIRSSSAEYLTFIAATGESGVDAIYADENVWLTQKMMGTLYNVETEAGLNQSLNCRIQLVTSDQL